MVPLTLNRPQVDKNEILIPGTGDPISCKGSKKFEKSVDCQENKKNPGCDPELNKEIVEQSGGKILWKIRSDFSIEKTTGILTIFLK
jgi:hypothetical protein